MNEDQGKKRIDLSDESGVTRRDLLRRGAIVGGTLLWVAPAIQSLSPAAQAFAVGHSEQHFCCFCRETAHPANTFCFNDHAPVSSTDCETFCNGLGMHREEWFGPRGISYTCNGTTGCSPKSNR